MISTPIYAALLALMYVALGLRVVGLRRKLATALGDGENPVLRRAIRVHANAVEWILPVLLVLLIAELNRAPALLLHVCGIALVVARVLHAIGLGRWAGRSTGRSSGAGITYVTLLVLAAWNLWAFVRLALT